MPFLGNAGQFSNIHEKNHTTTTLRIIEGDAAYQSYNPADSHYKLITNLEEISNIGASTSKTIEFTNVSTGFTTTSNVGIANANPIHTLDVGANVHIDDAGTNTFWTNGTTYADEYTGEYATIKNSVTVRDTITDKVFPKTNGFIQVLSNVGINNTAPIHTLDISANTWIDEFSSNTIYTSGNVHANTYTGDAVVITGSIRAADFVLTGGGQAIPTPDLQAVSESAAAQSLIPFSSDRTMTLSNVTSGLIANVINVVTTNSNVVSDNVTAINVNTYYVDALTVNSNLAGNNVTALTVNSNLAGNNVTALTVNSNLIGNNVTALTVNSNLNGNNVTALTVNSNLVGDNVTALTVNSNLIGNNVTALTVNSNINAGNVVTSEDLTAGTTLFVKESTNMVGINNTTPYKALDVTGEIECSSDLTVGGNLIVNGVSTTVNTQTLSVEDKIIEIGRNNTTGTTDVGIVMKRPSNSVAIVYNETDDKLELGYTSSVPTSSDIVISQQQLPVHIHGNVQVGLANLYVNTLTGNMGLGTIAPETKIHVQSSSSGELFRFSDGTRALYGGCDVDHPWIGTSTVHDLRFKTGDVEKARIKTDGKFGIGTETPLSTLTVKTSYNGGHSSGLCLDSNDGVDDYNFKVYSFTQSTGQVGYKFRINNQSTENDALTIGYDGKVGIGGASPVFDLDVPTNANVGTLTVNTISGDGSALTNINASNVSSGTIDNARLNVSSTSGFGIVQLNDTTSSTSTTEAATANAVKAAYDRNTYTSLNATTFTGALVGNSDTTSALQTPVNVGGVSFDGSASIDLPGVNTAGNQDTSGNSATTTALATARTIGGVTFDGSANINLPGVNIAGNQDTSGTAATANVLTTARTIGGVTFDGSANIDLPGVNTGGNQNTTGTASGLTTARNIGGVSFDGTADINLPGVNIAGNQNTSGNAATATALATARTIGGISFDGTANIDVPGVNIAGNQDTSGTAAVATSTNGNGKIVVQNGTDGGNTRGIWLWTNSDANWGIYMGQSGASKSLAGGTAVAGNGFSQYAVRFRAQNSVDSGFIWENSSELALLTLRGSDGWLWHSGSMYNSGSLESDGRIYADNGCHVRGDWLRVDGSNGIYFESYGGGWRMTDSTYIRAYNSKTIYTAGNILASGNITAYSDIRHKKDLIKIDGALEKVGKLNGYTYTRIDNEKRYTGVVAQEVLDVLPEAVHEEEDGHYSVAYGNMVGLLIESIKELKLEIDELKKSK